MADKPQQDKHMAQAADAEAAVETSNTGAKRKRRRWPFVVLSVLLVLCILCAVGMSLLNNYLNTELLTVGESGTIKEEYYTPKEYQGEVINILIVGVYREPTDNYPQGLGLTDMILYAQYRIKDNELRFLQIPRDSYVGGVPGSDGKINSLMVTGADKENPINNLVDCIWDQYRLPVDRYVIVDMEALKELVDRLYGLYVYVPQAMSHKGSSLEEGWQWLDGEAVEFFVRNRYGDGFIRGDIDRLDNQRHFYSALFRRLLNLTGRDIMNLLPFFAHYCTTDIAANDIYDLAFTALKLQSENVMFCKVPGATIEEGVWDEGPFLQQKTYYIVDTYGRGTEQEPGLANLLNEYFRYGDPVAAADLNIPEVPIPTYVTLYPPNLQVMGEVMEGEGGENVDVEHH